MKGKQHLWEIYERIRWVCSFGEFHAIGSSCHLCHTKLTTSPISIIKGFSWSNTSTYILFYLFVLLYLFFLFFLLLCWVEVHWAFTKVLTIYQIYHTWIHSLHHSPVSPPPPSPGTVSAGIIFSFTYMYTQYLYHTHLPTPFPHLLHPPTGTLPHSRQGRTCSALPFSNFIKEKDDIFV
jgi:hypothetical protein